MLLREVHERHAERRLVLGDDGEAGAVHRYRALDDAVTEDIRRRLIAGDYGVLLRRQRDQRPRGLRHAPHDVAGEPVRGPDGAFQVHRVAGLELAQVGAPVRLRHAVEVERLPVHVRHGEVNTVQPDGVAQRGAFPHFPAGDDQAAAVRLADGAYLFDDAGEHGGTRVQGTGNPEQGGYGLRATLGRGKGAASR